MVRRLDELVCILLVATLAACAPPPPAAQMPSAPAAGRPAQSPAQSGRTLFMITRTEPDSLAGTSMTGAGTSIASRRRLFNAGFTLMDGDVSPLPYLAVSLPQLNTDSWRVFPDGRMETTYSLRLNLSWHDGVPLTADDFVFAWEVYATPQFGRAGSEPVNMMQEVLAPDPRTVLIRWRGAYPEAGVLEAVVSTGAPTTGPTFTPLPRHILGRAYHDERDTFLSHPYWSVDFVGAGPYRLDRWESGGFIEAVAFDQHVLGRPKIDRVRLMWSTDANTVLAHLLSGEAHLPVDGSLGIPQGLVLRQEWSARNAGTVRFVPQNWWRLIFQFRLEYASPRAVLDERVRKAIAHTIDRQAINDNLFEGVGVVADSMMYPKVPYAQELDRAVAKYPLDPRRAEALMQEAGYRKGPDGFFASPGEGRLLFQVKGSPSAVNNAARAIMAAGWREAGLDTEEGAFTAAETQDGQALSTYRSLYAVGAPAGVQALDLYTTANIPRPENRWVGANRSGWSNPDYDRLADAARSILEPNDRAQAIIQAIKILTEQVGTVSLYFAPSTYAFSSAVHGVDFRAPEADPTWNLHEWELR